MHLVFASSILPGDAPATGYEIANAAILSALRRAGVKVTALGYCLPGKRPCTDAGAIVLGEMDVATAHASRSRKMKWIGQALAGGTTISSAKLRTNGPSAIREALDAIGPFDAFVLNAIQMAGAFPDIFLSRPGLFVAHNVEHVSAMQNAEAAESTLQRYFYRREARILKALETRFCRDAVRVIALSDNDAGILAAGAGHDRFSVLPLVTRQAFAPPRHDGSEFDAALVGTWTWEPNRIGLDWFLRQVTPHLPDDFTVRIAGSMPPGVDPVHPGVRFVGYVEDAADFVSRAAMVPLVARAGTGVQLKTIETFELGLPSVATALALRGIPHVPENCISTDDPTAFARAMVDQAANPVRLDGRQFHHRQQAALDAVMADVLADLARRIETRRAA